MNLVFKPRFFATKPALNSRKPGRRLSGRRTGSRGGAARPRSPSRAAAAGHRPPLRTRTARGAPEPGFGHSGSAGRTRPTASSGTGRTSRHTGDEKPGKQVRVKPWMGGGGGGGDGWWCSLPRWVCGQSWGKYFRISEQQTQDHKYSFYCRAAIPAELGSFTKIPVVIDGSHVPGGGGCAAWAEGRIRRRKQRTRPVPPSPPPPTT